MREHLAAGPINCCVPATCVAAPASRLLKYYTSACGLVLGLREGRHAGLLTAQTESAAAYALEGKMEEAKSSLAEARRINSSLTVKWTVAHSPNLPRALEGVRKAGLPEE